jgi:hypothetical protein
MKFFHILLNYIVELTESLIYNVKRLLLVYRWRRKKYFQKVRKLSLNNFLTSTIRYNFYYILLFFIRIVSICPLSLLSKIFTIEPSLYRKGVKQSILTSWWARLFWHNAGKPIKLHNAIRAQELVNYYSIPRETVSLDITAKILSTKNGFDDNRPMPYIHIRRFGENDSDDLNDIIAYKPLTPYPHIRYVCFCPKYNFREIIFDRAEAVNYYNKKNKFNFIASTLNDTIRKYFEPLESMIDSEVENQTKRSKINDYLSILLSDLQKSLEDNKENNKDYLEIINTLKNCLNLLYYANGIEALYITFLEKNYCLK